MTPEATTPTTPEEDRLQLKLIDIGWDLAEAVLDLVAAHPDLRLSPCPHISAVVLASDRFGDANTALDDYLGICEHKEETR
jgi:hypothetical protein